MAEILQTQLQAAINGDFTQLLVDPSIPGIMLNMEARVDSGRSLQVPFLQ
jgi:hypothetical protein